MPDQPLESRSISGCENDRIRPQESLIRELNLSPAERRDGWNNAHLALSDCSNEAAVDSGCVAHESTLREPVRAAATAQFKSSERGTLERHSDGIDQPGACAIGEQPEMRHRNSAELPRQHDWSGAD